MTDKEILLQLLRELPSPAVWSAGVRLNDGGYVEVDWAINGVQLITMALPDLGTFTIATEELGKKALGIASAAMKKLVIEAGLGTMDLGEVPDYSRLN